MITIDGSQGEGGGQILRSSLALSLITGKAFRIGNIRAGRKKPGLMRQHLTAVRGAAEVGTAEVRGAEIGAQELTFSPGEIRAGKYRFAVGTAGSTTLVFQTVLPALLRAGGPSTLTLEGGTHNPHAPPFDFLEQAFLPVINRMGPVVTTKLLRPGFFPAGGGAFTVEIQPTPELIRIDLLERGATRAKRAKAMVAKLPRSIGERELARVQDRLSLADDDLVLEEVSSSAGPGNILTIAIESEHITEVFTGFGEIGIPAESIAQQAVDSARKYLKRDVPVGEWLTDQLLLPFALAGGGSFRTAGLSPHALTNIEVIRQFLATEIAIEEGLPGSRIVRIGSICV